MTSLEGTVAFVLLVLLLLTLGAVLAVFARLTDVYDELRDHRTDTEETDA